ncbi:MAG: aminotransferase class IV [Thermodesulfovibrionales bacterium]
MVTQENRTLLFGEGLFETMHWRGITNKTRIHFNRLKSSADFFSIPCPKYDEFIDQVLCEMGDRLKVGDKGEKIVKYCLLSKGSGIYYKESKGYDYKVVIRDMPTVPSSVTLSYSPYSRHSKDPVVYHKTMNYTFNILVKRDAVQRGFYDAVVLNEKGMITECSSSNIIILKGSRLYSPLRDSGLLIGTCLTVFDAYKEILFRPLSRKDLKESDGIFITNSIIGVVPVIRLDDLIFDIDSDVCNHLNALLIKENSPLD